MPVPAYQIQNILTLYCRKLEQSWREEKSQGASHPLQINVIAQNRKETVINKVKESIVSKITILGPRQYMELHATTDTAPAIPLSKKSSMRTQPFSFTSLEKGNVRIQKNISLGNNDGA